MLNKQSSVIKYNSTKIKDQNDFPVVLNKKPINMQSATELRPAAKFIMVITAITAWVALSLQQYIIIDNTPDNGLTTLQAIGRFLIFFTILSNLLVAISLSAVLLSPASSTGHFFAKPTVIAAITLYILIVGLVYNLVLRNIWNPTGRDRVADELLHVAVPLLFVIYFLFFAPKARLPWKNLISWLIFPLVYLVYAMIRGAVEGFYPYPFLNLKSLSVEKVALNCTMVMVAFIIFGLLIIAGCRSIKREGKKVKGS